MSVTLRGNPRISHLLLDFDETLTEKDTISRLAAAAYSLHSPSAPRIPPWSYFVQAYCADSASFSEKTQCTFPETWTPIEKEICLLNSVLPVEKASIERIENGGVFKGLRPAELGKVAVETVDIREGFWKDMLQPAWENKVDVSVVSVNWSSVWIRETLRAAVSKESGDETLLDSKLKIYCNDLVVDNNGITTGMFSRFFKEQNEGVWTVEHKYSVMQEIIKDVTAADGLVVYVGDSSTDLKCLHAADVGIVVGDKLDKLCEKIGIRLIDGNKETQTLEAPLEPDVLVKVNGLRELARYIGLARK
ncbi:HAD-like domain-containing protein [Geopyxis carbonaria]|nr:HAD-like domain-containing protein [Geopyxis carbonaria]